METSAGIGGIGVNYRQLMVELPILIMALIGECRSFRMQGMQ